ncbi:MAG: ATP-binding cassette domain-containing protein [Anaerolineae bacterium]|nr:ATP-binding cassette domain-containing protein [Anaerolineae bacterium]
MSQNAFISVESVSKNYGNFRAVDHVSFDVYAGEIFAMLGPNGSGKTTTIRMVLDILKPDTGRISVLGGPLTDEKKDSIGYLPEERGLYRNASVVDVMVYLAGLKGLPRQEAKKRSLAMLEKLDLGEHAKSKVSELSKGMQQKVQFAVTILHEPQIIIVDEPFSGLDPVNTLLIKDLLLDFNKQGGAVVMSTHQMHQVEELADRMLMLSKGQQKLYGPVSEIREQFASHAIVVEGTGDWSALPGVASVETVHNGRDSNVLHLLPEATADSVLAAIAASPDTHIRRFELAVPSLNDIFIEVAGGDRHD